ncbi:MAG TPA: hypothetical protein PLK12_09410 [Prolixibacteraceae bacterium]|nr:hypothetical protein [Prolixibacteraceae bacterium]
MKKIILILAVIVSLGVSGVVAFISLSCQNYDDEITTFVKIQLINQSGKEVHLWTDGETIGPSNKCLNGYSRIVTLTAGGRDEGGMPNFVNSATAHAGLNGETISSYYFVIPSEYHSAGAVPVIYKGVDNWKIGGN